MSISRVPVLRRHARPSASTSQQRAPRDYDPTGRDRSRKSRRHGRCPGCHRGRNRAGCPYSCSVEPRPRYRLNADAEAARQRQPAVPSPRPRECVPLRSQRRASRFSPSAISASSCPNHQAMPSALRPATLPVRRQGRPRIRCPRRATGAGRRSKIGNGRAAANRLKTAGGEKNGPGHGFQRYPGWYHAPLGLGGCVVNRNDTSWYGRTWTTPRRSAARRSSMPRVSCFRERLCGNDSMSSIASKVGGSKTTLPGPIFRRRSDLFAAVVDGIVEQYGDALTIELPLDEPVPDVLRRVRHGVDDETDRGAAAVALSPRRRRSGSLPASPPRPSTTAARAAARRARQPGRPKRWCAAKSGWGIPCAWCSNSPACANQDFISSRFLQSSGKSRSWPPAGRSRRCGRFSLSGVGAGSGDLVHPRRKSGCV